MRPPGTHVGPVVPRVGETFGQWLKGHRERLGLSLRDVERATEGAISNAALSQIESGKIATPGIVTVAYLTGIYGLESGEVFERSLAGNHYVEPLRCLSCGQVIR